VPLVLVLDTLVVAVVVVIVVAVAVEPHSSVVVVPLLVLVPGLEPGLVPVRLVRLAVVVVVVESRLVPHEPPRWLALPLLGRRRHPPHRAVHDCPVRYP